MDPVSHMALGAAVAAVVSRPGGLRTACLVGAAAGAAPDLDVFIRSAEDPLLGLTFHRHFTHALVVAPLIGLFFAGLFKVLINRRCRFSELALYGIAGVSVHGLLDACTSYGTQLYWPFLDYRESWDVISVIDPLFTLPLLLCLGVAFISKRRGFAGLGLIACLCYLGFGLVQRERAQAFAEALAVERGHGASMLTVRPSFANLMAWRLVYREGDRYHVDAVTLLPFREPVLYAGASVPVFSEAEAAAVAAPGTVLAADIERFRFFSQGYLYRAPEDPMVLGDLRYATLPNQVRPLWGIRLDPAQPDAHVQMAYFRDASKAAFSGLWAMVLGQSIEADPESR